MAWERWSRPTAICPIWRRHGRSNIFELLSERKAISEPYDQNRYVLVRPWHFCVIAFSGHTSRSREGTSSRDQLFAIRFGSGSWKYRQRDIEGGRIRGQYREGKGTFQLTGPSNPGPLSGRTPRQRSRDQVQRFRQRIGTPSTAGNMGSADPACGALVFHDPANAAQNQHPALRRSAREFCPAAMRTLVRANLSAQSLKSHPEDRAFLPGKR